MLAERVILGFIVTLKSVTLLLSEGQDTAAVPDKRRATRAGAVIREGRNRIAETVELLSSPIPAALDSEAAV